MTNWPNFSNRTCLLPKLFSKMFSLFYAKAFYDVMRFSRSKILKLDCLENEKNFEVKKIVFPSFTSFF